MSNSSLQARLEVTESDDRDGAGDGAVETFRHLESSGHFHRDSGLGRVFHPGGVSLREDVPTNSLHVVIHGNRISAHVDRLSPLGVKPESTRTRYSVRRAVAHNLVGMAQDAVRLLRGRQGDHRCELNCEWVTSADEATPRDDDLLDPATSAWSLHLEARVSGSIDAERLGGAVIAVLRGRSPRPGDEAVEVVDCADDAAVDAARARLHTRAVRITDGRPFQVQLARTPEGDVVMASFNHAAADAFAAVRVLRSVAAAYRGDARSAGRPLDFLATRQRPVRPASAPVPAPLLRCRAAVEWLRDVLSRPARLAPEEAVDDPAHGFRLIRLSPGETGRLLAGTDPETSRDRVMAALHLAIGDWNLRHGTPGRRIGVLMPVNLRPDDWPEERIGNFSVTTRVSTSRRHRSGPAAARRAIRSQTTRSKRSRTGTALIAALARVGLLPLWAKQSLVVLEPLTGNRLVDTAMLANLGTIEEPVWFGPEAGAAAGMWFSVPARSPNSLCAGVVVVDDRLHLTVRWPRRLFGVDAADEFARCFLDQLGRVADAGPGRRRAP